MIQTMEYKFLKFIFGGIAILMLTTSDHVVNAQQEPINVCDNVANNIFVADVTNCSNYYICINGQPIPQQCDNGRFFNGKSQSCDVNKSQCLDCSNPNALTFSPLSKTCNKYVMCFAGEPIIRQCADNLQYNAASQNCDLPSKVDCVENKCPIYNDPDNVIYIPSYSSCDKYYICLSGLPNNRTCASGLQFSSDCDCCDLTSKVHCKIVPLSRRSVDFDVMLPERVNIDCPKTGVHFYPHKNLNQYYVCSAGQGAVLSCASGLFYDPHVQECRQMKNVRFD